MQTLTLVLSIIALVLGFVGSVLHMVKRDTLAARFDAFGTQLEEIAKRLGGAAGVVLAFVLAGVVAAQLAACGPSAREKTISTTMTAVNAGAAGFVAFDAKHQAEIVNLAPDAEHGRQELAAWRVTQVEVETDLATAYRAVAVAAQLNDDQSLASMLQAAAVFQSALRAIGVTQ